MPVSPEFSTSNQFVKYIISVDELSTSIEDNTSLVRVQVNFYRTNAYTTYGTGTVYCRVSGIQYEQAVTPSQEITADGIVLFDKTLTVQHYPDGSRDIYVDAWISHNAPLYSDPQGFTADLTTIPRASTPTVTPDPATFGSVVEISTNRVSDAFTHTVRASWQGRETTIASDVTDSTTWTVPAVWVQDIPDSMSGTATVYLDTYSAGSLLGTKSTELTLTVSTASAPTFVTFSAADANGATAAVTGDNSLLVQGYSQILVTVPAASRATSPSGATIRKYIASCGSRSAEAAWSASDDVVINLGAAESGTVAVAAVDSRGQQTAVTKVLTLIPYTPPVIRSSTLTRQNGIEEKTTLSFSTSIYSDPIGQSTNAVTDVSYRWRPSQGEFSAGETQIPTAPRWSGFIAGDLPTGFTSMGSYEIELTVFDKIAGRVVLLTLNSGRLNVDIYRKGLVYGLGIGKRWEQGLIDIAAGGVAYGGQLQAGVLVESGQKGIWRWLKWSDGTAMCWGTKKYTVPPARFDAWGKLYATPDGFYKPEKYPFAFVEASPQLPTRADSGIGSWACIDSTQDFDPLTQTTPFILIRPNNLYANNLTPTMVFFAVGRWK